MSLNKNIPASVLYHEWIKYVHMSRIHWPLLFVFNCFKRSLRKRNVSESLFVLVTTEILPSCWLEDQSYTSVHFNVPGTVKEEGNLPWILKTMLEMKGKFSCGELHRWQGAAIVGGVGIGANSASILQKTKNPTAKIGSIHSCEGQWPIEKEGEDPRKLR